MGGGHWGAAAFSGSTGHLHAAGLLRAHKIVLILIQKIINSTYLETFDLVSEYCKVSIQDFRPLCAHSANFEDDNLPIFSSGVNCSRTFRGNFDQHV